MNRPRGDLLGVTVDTVLFTLAPADLRVLLVRRRFPPFAGRWAIPGGFVEAGEPLEAAAARELREETGARGFYLEQLYTFGDPGRDPRGRVVTVVYFSLIPPDRVPTVRGGDDAAEARWFSIYRLPALAFDHDRILKYALGRLRAKFEYTTLAFKLLPIAFTLPDLQQAYETVFHRRLDKRNFRKRVLALGLLKSLSRFRREGAHRPARLYRLKDRKVVLFQGRTMAVGS